MDNHSASMANDMSHSVSGSGTAVATSRITTESTLPHRPGEFTVDRDRDRRGGEEAGQQAGCQ
jgi:hypothetical protein